jgi:hypothetical protein
VQRLLLFERAHLLELFGALVFGGGGAQLGLGQLLLDLDLLLDLWGKRGGRQMCEESEGQTCVLRIVFFNSNIFAQYSTRNSMLCARV